MPDVAFLQDLAIIMIVAGVVTIIFHRLKQPVVLGYILAGLIIGPHTLPIPMVSNEVRIHTLSDLGLVFLMFGLGLHFSLRKLAQVGAAAFVTGAFEIALMLLIGYGVGRLMGWQHMESLFLAAIVSISSTTIIVKVVTEMGRAKERFAQLIFGVLIVEDVLAIAMLALLSSIALSHSPQVGQVIDGSLRVGQVMETFGRLAIFLAVVLVLGLLAVPVILRYVAKFKSDEMLLVAVLGLGFGVSLLAVKLGYSVALGAFLIGAIMAEAREAGRIETLISPLRDMFTAVYFVAIGMLIDPGKIGRDAVPIIICTIVVVLGKTISCSVGAFIAGNDTKTSLRVGMGMGQIGEFSFIIAQLGLTLPHASDPGSHLHALYPIAVYVSVITTLLTPYRIRGSDPIADFLERSAPSGLQAYLHLYTNWIGGLRGGDGTHIRVQRLLRKWAIQLGINLALVSGVMITASSLAASVERLLPEMKWLPPKTGGPKTILWMAAMVIALPLLIASFRKVRAAAAIIADLRNGAAGQEENVTAVRAVIANTILIAGGVVIVMWVMLLSSAILPPWPVFITLAGVILAIVTLMGNSFLRVYAKAQTAIRETLTQNPTMPQEEPRPIPPLLQDAVLETITLAQTSPANGKLIRELQLRSETGASIVGIERVGGSIVNPGPDEELRAGDRVLLLGTEEHLESAESFLAPELQEPKEPKKAKPATSKPVRRRAKLRGSKTRRRQHSG
ncbi:MAG TPA: cation:proton antiporter [Tepidisphaeraceae bacterium]|jgi:CPA2 family monovalent cation:H+ antiporter-2|nr:cation:proton antiporter [Tepidisphaeraceae bacterium]